MIKSLRFALALALATAGACGDPSGPGNTPPLFTGASVAGTWTMSGSAGALYDVRFQLTEASDRSIGGSWSGYRTGCTPMGSASCLRSGTVATGSSRTGTAVTLRMIASLETAMSGTASFMMTSPSRMAGPLKLESCCTGTPVVLSEQSITVSK